MATVSGGLRPLTPNWIDDIVDALETNHVHAQKVELGWCSPDGKELSWQYWRAQAPNYWSDYNYWFERKKQWNTQPQ